MKTPSLRITALPSKTCPMDMAGRRKKCTQGFLRCLVMLALVMVGSMSASADDKTPEYLKDRIVGDYQLRGVMETTSGIRLSNNGTYRFFLIYGSVDETDVGTWQVKGSTVILNTTAPDNDPNIEFVRSFHDDFDGVRISFEGDGAALAAVATTVVLRADGREFRANEVSNNIRQSRSAAPPLQSIAMSFMGAMRTYRIFEFAPQNPAHNHYVFRATAGNYGSVRFNGTRLQIGDHELYLMLPNMHQRFRYVREKTGRESAP